MATVVVVRLGRYLYSNNGGFTRGIKEFLRDVRTVMVIAGIEQTLEQVEMEVNYEPFALDENIEALRISVIITETNEALRLYRDWLDCLHSMFQVILSEQKVDLDLVPSFQATLVIGGHRYGAVCNRRTTEIYNLREDPYLITRAAELTPT